MNITLANYPSMAPKVNWSKYPSVQKEVYDQNKAGSLDFEYWKEFLEDEEIKEIVAKHIAVLNTAKGSAKGKAVIAKATKAKTAKAGRATATKEFSANRTRKVKDGKAKIKAQKPLFKVNDYIKIPKGSSTDVVRFERVTSIDKKEPFTLNMNQNVPVFIYNTITESGKRSKYSSYEIESLSIVKATKSESVIAKATKAKTAKASRTTATKKVAAKRAASKPKVEPVKAVTKQATKAKPGPKAKAMAKPKATPKPKVVKAKAPAKPKVTQAEKDKATLTKLKNELTTVKAKVVSNAKFKAKIGDELTKYLKANGLDKQVGLSGTPDEIEKVRTQLKFYKGLLEGDTSDFKTIGKRVGIIYQVKPVKDPKPNASAKPKAAPVKETPKELEFEKVWLSYNQYKGSGKAWVAKVNEDGKILGFLDVDVNEKDGYKGRKLFKVPLIEGQRYKLNEEGSKSRDDTWFVVIKNGKITKD